MLSAIQLPANEVLLEYFIKMRVKAYEWHVLRIEIYS